MNNSSANINEQVEPLYKEIAGYNTPMFNAVTDVIRNGNNFAHLALETEVELYAKVNEDGIGGRGVAGATIPNPHKGRVKKHVTGLSVAIATNSYINAYASAQTKRLKDGGNSEPYQLKPHAYAVQVAKDTAIMVHKKDSSREYLRYIEQENQVYKETYYTLDGEVIAYNDIQGTKPKPKPRVIGTNQKTGEDIVSVEYRLVTTSNIRRLSAGGKKLDF